MSRGVRYIALISMLVLAAASLILAGCGGTATTTTAGGGTTTTAAGESTNTTAGGGGEGKTFKFGLAAPLTGQYANYGGSHKGGIDIAVAELNAAGGVKGAQVAYVAGDDQGDPKEGVLVAQKLIDDKDVLFVNGHMFSGATLAAGPKYQEAGLPMITPSATNPDITDLGDYIWRTCMTDAAQGEGLAEYAVITLGVKKIAIVHSDNDYGKGLADAFEAAAKAAGGEIVAREQYTDGDTDFKAQLTKVKDQAPELIFLSGYYPEGSKIAAQAKELGLNTQLLGSDGFGSDELIKLGGASVEGMLISTFFDYSKDDPAIQKFVTTYKANNNGDNPDWFAAAAYDVVMLMASLVEKSGDFSREGINQALSAMTDEYQGITGRIKFDENGDVVKPLNIVIVKDGRLVTAPKQP
ncbi:MAG: ABC transporter substrate-binding protein [Actinobacteria bacterium]|nr:ABC transporter substrate-binding protein [Actinomycetota bacterium]